jgi:putative DNA primase/helicase
VSGFDVLDVDPRHGGDESLAKLEAEHGKLPDTVEALTGGGGRHILFKHREGVRSSAGHLPGLDVRGDGGYVVVAPSIHETGREYAWEASSQPGEVELSEWPVWLLQALQNTNGKVNGGPDSGKIQEGQRHVSLMRWAGSMRRPGMSEEAIAAALLVENAARCEPPLSEPEVGDVARSACRYEPAIPATSVRPVCGPHTY